LFFIILAIFSEALPQNQRFAMLNEINFVFNLNNSGLPLSLAL